MLQLLWRRLDRRLYGKGSTKTSIIPIQLLNWIYWVQCSNHCANGVPNNTNSNRWRRTSEKINNWVINYIWFLRTYWIKEIVRYSSHIKPMKRWLYHLDKSIMFQLSSVFLVLIVHGLSRLTDLSCKDWGLYECSSVFLY